MLCNTSFCPLLATCDALVIKSLACCRLLYLCHLQVVQLSWIALSPKVRRRFQLIFPIAYFSNDYIAVKRTQGCQILRCEYFHIHICLGNNCGCILYVTVPKYGGLFRELRLCKSFIHENELFSSSSEY